MKFKPVTVTLKNNITITVREAVKADAASLLEAGITYLAESPYLISTINEFNFTKQQEMAWIKSLEESDNSLLLVAVYGSKVIGNIHIRGEIRQKVKHNAVMGIAILQQWQSIGLGTFLLQSVIDWAIKNKYLQIITLNVHANNTKGIGLYKKLQFEQIGYQKKYIREADGSYTDNIIMQLALNKSY